MEDPPPQEDRLAVHWLNCTALLGDLRGVNRSMEHDLLSVLLIYLKIFLRVFIAYRLLLRFLFVLLYSYICSYVHVCWLFWLSCQYLQSDWHRKTPVMTP